MPTCGDISVVNVWEAPSVRLHFIAILGLNRISKRRAAARKLCPIKNCASLDSKSNLLKLPFGVCGATRCHTSLSIELEMSNLHVSLKADATPSSHSNQGDGQWPFPASRAPSLDHMPRKCVHELILCYRSFIDFFMSEQVLTCYHHKPLVFCFTLIFSIGPGYQQHSFSI